MVRLSRHAFPVFPNRKILTSGSVWGCTIGATWGVTTLWMADSIETGQYLFSWWTWWVGDVVGVILLAPITVACSLPQPHAKRRWAQVGLPMLIGLFLVFGAYYAASWFEMLEKESHFRQIAADAAQRVSKEFEIYLIELDAIARHIATNPDLDQEQFRAFVRPVIERQPGIKGFSWNVRIEDSERVAFEKSMREAGFPQFEILERSPKGSMQRATQASEYVSIKLIEPIEKNRVVHGMDVNRLESRRLALIRARETCIASATDCISLAQQWERPDGIIVFQAIYESPVEDVLQDPLRQPLGYATLVVQVGDVVEKAIPQIMLDELFVRIEKAAANGSKELIHVVRGAESISEAVDSNFHFHHRLLVAGQELILHATPTQGCLNTVRTWQPWFVELGGLLFISLLVAFLLFVTGQQSYQEELVATRTSELKLTANKLQSILDASTKTAIIATDAKGVITLFNSGAERLLGYKADEMVGKATAERFHLASEVETFADWLNREHGYRAKGFEALVARALDGWPDQQDWTYVHKDGRQFLTDLKVTSQRNSQGELTGFLAIAQDVTESRRANERFRVLFEHSSDAHLLFGEGGIIDCNRATLEMLRCKHKSEVIGLHPAVLSPEIQPDGKRSMEKCLEMDATARRLGHHRFDWLHRRFDGEEFLCEVTLTPVIIDSQEVLLVVWHDLSERVQAQKALIESEERLRLSLDNSKQGFWDWNLVTNEAVVDAEWSSLLDFPSGVVSDPIVALRSAVHPEDMPELQSTLENYLGNIQGVFRHDFRVRSKAGGWIWVNVCGRVCQYGPGGEPTRIIGTSQEISERKEFEKTLADRNAELARSNSELEQFAYVASHDLREPLRMVQSFCSLLQARYAQQLDDRARQYIGFAVDGAARMQRLVDDLLEFSRIGRQNEKFEWVPLESVVATALENLSAAVQESNATIDIGPLPIVHGDAARLGQVFQNLLGNAIKFRGHIPPVIRVSATECVDHWRISVSDNGIGIDPGKFRDSLRSFNVSIPTRNTKGRE